MKTLTLLLPLFFASTNDFWKDRHAEGWAWYEEQKEELSPTSPLKKNPTEQLAGIKKDLEEKLAKALIEPSEENLEAYIQAQKYWIDRSAEFSRLWAKVVLKNPELDETIQHPVSQYGIQVEQEILREKKYALIRSLASSHGLFFFYEGKNKASQAFAYIVKEFMKKHAWDALAISMDGTLIEGFPNSRQDTRVAEKLGIGTFPSLVLVNPKTNQMYPIAFGMISLDQIENNILLHFEGGKDDK
jgi:conjugal transfer pilus assembly protein TraF